ncbi:integral membrane protein [Colletotrichum cereale]|nr:integral membrane protein [Colletotrichum cereale]
MDPQSQTLAPLPDVLHRGLTALSFFGALSFVSTTALFLILTYRLVVWYLTPEPGWPQRIADEPNPDAVLAEEMGLPETMYPEGSKRNRRRRDSPNQFLMLIYNLLLADIQQSIAFSLNASWLVRNAIVVETTTCWAQGWFVSTGDLASSAFITTIAVHTYLSVVRDYKLPTWAFWTMIGSVWFFVYALAIAGVVATNNGAAGGGLYVRAAAWCWINVRYEAMRLYLHYLWMFVSFFVTAVLYILVFNHIRRTDPSLQLPSSSNNTTSSASKSSTGRSSRQTHGHSPSGLPTSSHGDTPKTISNNAGHHPAFLIYPVIYILCTAPLALGRVITMTGHQVSLEYFCLAGVMIASNGWLDVLLFSTTRHVIMFSASPDCEEIGLATFAFMRTPANRRFGNMVWVQGAGSTPLNLPSEEGTGGWLGRWFRKSRRGRDTKGDRHRSSAHRSVSQESLRRRGGNAEGIQMETVTTVVIEVENQPGGKKINGRSHSIDTIDKERAQSFGSM